MKQIMMIALIGAIFYSCGDEGIGFNARKEVGVDASMEIPSVPVSILVPEQRQDISFNLEDVTGDLEYLDEIKLNGVSYEISGIESEEELDIDELTVTLNALSQEIEFISLTRLENTNGKVQINLTPSQLQALQQQMFDRKELDGEVFLDLIDFPDEDLEFAISTYFDVTAKIRNI